VDDPSAGRFLDDPWFDPERVVVDVVRGVEFFLRDKMVAGAWVSVGLIPIHMLVIEGCGKGLSHAHHRRPV